MFEAQERAFRVGQDMITLRGDLLAGMAYAQIVRSINKQRAADGEEPYGDTLEQAFVELLPQLQAYEEGEELPKILDPTPWILLFWAFSAQWRHRTGWNRKHSHESDGKVPSHEQMRFIEFVSVGMGHMNALRPVIFDLILAAMADPSGPALEKASEQQA